MSLFESVQNQIREAFSFIQGDFDKNLLEKVLYPNQILEVSIPVHMDDGATKIFTGYRSQHNNARGPYKGGIRFHQNVSKDEVMSLSAWMSLKCGVVGIPLGGGKGGIIVNPKELSENELEQLSRGFISKIAHNIGPTVDVPAPDVNTNPKIMGWMVDEYSKLQGEWTPGVITGKPLTVGGSQGRGEATALGGFYVLNTYLDHYKDALSGKSIAIQGAGNAGLTFAKFACEAGAKVVAISDSKGAIYNEAGLDAFKIMDLKQTRKSVTEYIDGKKITNEALLELDVEILVPAALEGVITDANADKIKAKIILEIANGPIIPEADKILAKNNIPVIPDVLANAGGVTVSYFEQVQNNTNYYWDKDEVNDKLAKIINPATLEVIEIANKYNTILRNGAYIVSLKRILEAMRDRGL